MKLISIIVPVYNSAQYLRRCVDSIYAQTYKAWEAVFVDDGSTDDSFSILTALAAEDERIHVFHQENAGAGMARNLGISKAKGDYVVFLDSDDTIHPDYLMRLSRHDEDVVFIDVQDVDENGRVLRREYMTDYVNRSLDDIIRLQMTGTIPWGAYRRAVKRKLLIDNNIIFSNQRIGEEAVYSFNVLYVAQSWAFMSQPMYNYLQHTDSLSNSHDDDPWGGIPVLYKLNLLNNSTINGGGYDTYASTLNAFILAAAAGSFDRLARYYSYKEYRRKAEARRQQCLQEIDKDYDIDYVHLGFKAKFVGRLILRERYLTIYTISKLYRFIRQWAKL